MASLQSKLLRVALRLIVRRELARNRHDFGAFIAAARRAFEFGANARRDQAGLRIVAIDEPGVRGEWLLRPGVAVGERAMLYLHGGGMVACHPRQYRSITVPLAGLTGVPVFSLDYRLAPEHPYPAALDDAIAAYDALRRQIPAAAIVIAGDSAGGNLALATVLRLRERDHMPRPVAGIIAISPWTDLLGRGGSIVANEASEDILVSPRVPGVALAFAYAPRDSWRDPLVSPLYGDYVDSPPLLAFASSEEMLLDDARALVARVRSQGGIATLVQEAEMPHAWPIFPMLPEARAAHTTMAEFVSRSFAAASPKV